MANAYVDALIRALTASPIPGIAKAAGLTTPDNFSTNLDNVASKIPGMSPDVVNAMLNGGALNAAARPRLNLADRGYPSSNGANDAYSAAALAALANARQSNLASRGFPSTAMPTTMGRPTRINKFSPMSHMKQR